MYDVIVIGGGPGGYVAAIRAAQNGLSVALVERDALGGTCLNRGCIPTKALVRSAEVLATVRRAAEFGVRLTGGAELDWPAVQIRKNRVVANLTGGVGQLLKAYGIEVIHDSASVPGPGRVLAGERELTAQNIILATGSHAARIPLPEADLALTLDSDAVLALETLPATMVVIGGGVIGMEFASIFAALGVKVTVFERLPQIVPNLDQELAQRLSLVLRKAGAAIHTGATVTGVQTAAGETGRIVAATAADGTPLSVMADLVLLAVGRVPDFGGIDLSGLGIEHDRRRGIAVDEQMRTNVPVSTPSAMSSVGRCSPTAPRPRASSPQMPSRGDRRGSTTASCRASSSPIPSSPASA
jgi:dihydrolipoamide dehydrogenase